LLRHGVKYINSFSIGLRGVLYARATPQSFKVLKQEYDEDECNDVPNILRSHLPFVMYMILTMPHKLNTDIIKIMYGD